MEAQLDQLLGKRRGNRRLAIDPLQGQLANPPGAHRLRQGRERRQQRLVLATGGRGRTGRDRGGRRFGESHQPAAAALDVQQRLILHHHHISTGDARRTARRTIARLPVLPSRPR
jgi:hypothetical protein